MTKEQFIAIQSALSYTHPQMGEACAISSVMVRNIRTGKRRLTPRVQKRVINALNNKIVELQRLSLFVLSDTLDPQ